MYLYNDYVVELHNKFQRRLEGISADFNFDYGDEFEIAICEILRDFLPLKYGICRGHIVARNGEKQGDDIIVYDQERFPTLKLNKREDYSRKENIPIEAVYAYFEAKHNLTETTFQTAMNQIIAVKKLLNSREQMPVFRNDPYVPNGIGMMVEGYPHFRNASFAGIITKVSSLTIDDDDKGVKHLRDLFQNFTKANLEALPEVVISGPSLVGDIGFLDSNKDFIPTLFTLNDKINCYQVRFVSNLSYGFFLIKLFAAIDWIRLNKMPWIDMLNEFK